LFFHFVCRLPSTEPNLQSSHITQSCVLTNSSTSPGMLLLEGRPSDGYHQIWVALEDCDKTAFTTRYCPYEYTVMSSGQTNASSAFQITMNEVFWPQLDKCVIVDLDDILIYKNTRKEHAKHAEAVFTLLQVHHLFPKGVQVQVFTHEAVIFFFQSIVEHVMKKPRTKPTGQLQPISTPGRPWQQVSMDFVTGLPAGPSGNDSLFVFVDRLTKTARFAVCKKSIIAEQTAKLFMATADHWKGMKLAGMSVH
ncbi:hypothetical protein CLOP_g5922, partial [Closterium sp. NIES-67]